jgi:hypothetical protein
MSAPIFVALNPVKLERVMQIYLSPGVTVLLFVLGYILAFGATALQ